MSDSLLECARKNYHASLRDSGLLIWTEVINKKKKITFQCPSNADASSEASVFLASHICELLGVEKRGAKMGGQSAGKKFEELTMEYICETFPYLQNLRPGKWRIQRKKTESFKNRISNFAQYSYLNNLEEYIAENPIIATSIGNDYLVVPDIVVAREQCQDFEINSLANIVSKDCARLTALRASNNGAPILHASISAKWTIRSDRSQNSRTEALNLIRNRKGPLPHIAVVTAEPLPSRLASIALGTGDIDCVYHFALPELAEAANKYAREGHGEAISLLNILIEGQRLRDISDLPLDLAI